MLPAAMSRLRLPGRSLFLLAVVCAAPAFAQPTPPDDPGPRAPQPSQRSAAAGGSAVVPAGDPAAAHDLFRRLDRTGDGSLTADELWTLPGQEANWAAIDRNRDGRISPEEFTVLRR